MVLVHEDGLFGSGLAKVMQQELPKLASRSWRRCRSHALARSVQRGAAPALAQSDLVIPSTYYGETVLLARTMQQQRVRPKASMAC